VAISAGSGLQTPTSQFDVAATSRMAPAGDFVASRFTTERVGRRAVDWHCLGTGLGCPSRPLRAAAPGVSDLPDVPTNLSSSEAGTTVTLSWSVTSGGDAATSFVIEAGSSPGSTDLAVFDTGSPVTALTITGVPPGTYFVRVRARNASGTSGPSNEVVVVVGTTPLPGPCAPTPSAPTNLASTVSGLSFTLQWNGVAGALSYIIEAGSTSGATNLAVLDTGTAANSFSAAAPAGTYYVRVRAKTTCGTSGASNEIVLTLPGGGLPGSNLSGLWSGLSPIGVLAPNNDCERELDLFLTLTQSGSSLSGSGTIRLRLAGPAPGCINQVGATFTGTVSGSVSASGIGFTLTFQEGDETRRMVFTGTVAANSMSGAVVFQDDEDLLDDTQGTWAVVRQ
jgi:hypothetical protein